MVDNKGITDEQVDIDDELADWFTGSSDDEDQSASEAKDEEEETSYSPSDITEEPDTETPTEAAEEEPAAEEGTSDAPAQSDPYQWVQELDPEIRKHAEALVHRYRSDSGRVAALQARLDRETAQKEAKAVTATTRRSTPAVEGGKTDTTDEALKTFQEDYPTVAENVEKMIQARVQDAIASQVSPLREQALAEERYKEKESLRQHAARIFNSAETDIQLEEVLNSPAWTSWLEAQPSGYREFARTAKKAEDASKVLEDFAQYAERQAYAEYMNSDAGRSEQKAAKGAGNADQVVARRKEALAGAIPKSKTSNQKDESYGSYEDAFNYFAEGGK